MCFQNGYPDQPESEREQAWMDPDDEAAEAWKGAALPWELEGEDWREHPMSPEEKMYRDLLEDEDDGA